VTAGRPLLSAQNLRVRRGGIIVLDIPDFQLHPGEFVSLIGPNGSGKSSLLLALMCLIERERGRIAFRGLAIDSAGQALEYRRRVAMVFQEPLLFDTTVFQNVVSGLKLRGIEGRVLKQRAGAILERFELSRLAERHARKLSGGEARRVSLARAFAVEPEMILFDEPFANLDPPTRQVLSKEIEQIIRDTGIAAILVTHDQSEALRLSDRIVVMKDGRIVQSGVPEEVMNRPVNPFVAQFVGMDTVLPGVVTRSGAGFLGIAISGQEIQAVGNVAVGQQVYCGLRPENIVIDRCDASGVAGDGNCFPGLVVDIASQRPLLKLSVDCGFPLCAYVTADAFTALGLPQRKRVLASFKPAAVHVFPRPP
jgi:tungstate transport system ATP-binding protein